jgi:hypothetical protein
VIQLEEVMKYIPPIFEEFKKLKKNINPAKEILRDVKEEIFTMINNFRTVKIAAF